MDHVKHAVTNYPILDVLADRWSPYSFEPRGVEPDKVRLCLEAARWAASSFNEQPWYFLVSRREDAPEFQRMLACLVESNQTWARNAGVLMLTVVARRFSRNGKPNRVAEHDLGLAAGNLCCQATHVGLSVHQMAGVDLDAVRREYQVPEGYDPWTAMALGYAASPSDAPTQELGNRDRAPRTRKPWHEFVFSGQWGNAAELERW